MQYVDIGCLRKLISFTMLAIAFTFITCIFIALCPPNVSGHSRSLFERNASLNDRPIIGVLAQEISYHLKSHFSEDYTSYIAASYVKFVEGAGARVVPIWIGKDKSYYENILSKVNGVLWPGGSTYFNQSNGYADAGHTIYKIARRMNNNGNYFPIFGICLGMELMTYLVANRTEHRIHCNSTNQPLPLEFLQGYRKGELFKNAPSNVISALRNEEVTGNYHQFCVTRKNLKNVGISEKFRVLSLNHDFNGEEFISSLEHVTFPFYGLQFHPEKNIYEWIEGKRIPHGETPVMVAQYFANFFVNEARKNDNRFPTVQEESESLIYNYPVQYTGLMKSAFVQCYVFKKNETRN